MRLRSLMSQCCCKTRVARAMPRKRGEGDANLQAVSAPSRHWLGLAGVSNHPQRLRLKEPVVGSQYLAPAMNREPIKTLFRLLISAACAVAVSGCWSNVNQADIVGTY